MKSYSVVHKYTGRNLMVVFARTETGAKQWFTRNARHGLSSDYWFYELSRIYAPKPVKAPGLAIRFEPVTYAGVFLRVIVNDKYSGLLNLTDMTTTRNSKTEIHNSIPSMLNSFLPDEYAASIDKNGRHGVYSVWNTELNKVIGELWIFLGRGKIEYISKK